MKKFILGVAAIVALFATSCQQESNLGVKAGKTATVSIKLNTPEIASRAYSDGTTATALQYAVYNAEGTELTDLTVVDETINMRKEIDLQLTTGNTYTLIFWAAAPDAPYTVDFGGSLANAIMTVDYSTAKTLCNDEKRDAFWVYHTFTVTGTMELSLELKRPFAQLNVGTNDYAKSTSAGYTVTQSKIEVPAYTKLYLATGVVDGETKVTFDFANIPQGETFPVAGYDYMAMNYILMSADKVVREVTISYTDGVTPKTRPTVGSVPLQRNYRTNLFGQLLTGNVKVNVEIKPEYDDEHDMQLPTL
ncbi:MAG: hypothetical protein IKA07_05765 [Alistipes sp.]|nr:hypothetical protein [Alistipes sp.]